MTAPVALALAFGFVAGFGFCVLLTYWLESRK